MVAHTVGPHHLGPAQLRGNNGGDQGGAGGVSTEAAGGRVVRHKGEGTRRAKSGTEAVEKQVEAEGPKGSQPMAHMHEPMPPVHPPCMMSSWPLHGRELTHLHVGGVDLAPQQLVEGGVAGQDDGLVRALHTPARSRGSGDFAERAFEC